MSSSAVWVASFHPLMLPVRPFLAHHPMVVMVVHRVRIAARGLSHLARLAAFQTPPCPEEKRCRPAVAPTEQNVVQAP